MTPLVSDIPGAAPLTDPDLVNGWGLARSDTSPWWVADNGPDPDHSKSTLYTGAGAKVSLTVDVLGGPTGAVFAGVPGSFEIGTATDPTPLAANFVFATEDDGIRAWRGGDDRARRSDDGHRRRRDLQGSGDRQADPGQPAAVRDGLPQR